MVVGNLGAPQSTQAFLRTLNEVRQFWVYPNRIYTWHLSTTNRGEAWLHFHQLRLLLAMRCEKRKGPEPMPRRGKIGGKTPKTWGVQKWGLSSERSLGGPPGIYCGQQSSGTQVVGLVPCGDGSCLSQVPLLPAIRNPFPCWALPRELCTSWSALSSSELGPF